MARSRALPATCGQAYREIEANGLLSRMRFRVYDLLFRDGPLTQREVDVRLGTDSGHKRVSELVERRVVRAVGERSCSVSGQLAVEWDVTDGLPVEPQKPDAPLLTGREKALAEIKAAIPEKRRSQELRDLLAELEYVTVEYPSDIDPYDI